MLCADSSEPASDSVCLPLCLFPAHALSLSVSQRWINVKKKLQKRGLYTVQCLALQEVSLVYTVHSAIEIWLLFPTGRSSTEVLLACSGDCLDLLLGVL